MPQETQPPGPGAQAHARPHEQLTFMKSSSAAAKARDHMGSVASCESPPHAVQQSRLWRCVVSEYTFGSRKEPVSRFDSGGRFRQAGVDLVQMLGDPCHEAAIEGVVDVDSSREIPRVESAVRDSHGECLLTSHGTQGIVQNPLKSTGFTERFGTLPDGPDVRANRIRAQSVSVSQPQEIGGSAALQQTHVIEVSASHVVDQLSHVPLVAGSWPGPLLRSHRSQLPLELGTGPEEPIDEPFKRVDHVPQHARRERPGPADIGRQAGVLEVRPPDPSACPGPRRPANRAASDRCTYARTPREPHVPDVNGTLPPRLPEQRRSRSHPAGKDPGHNVHQCTDSLTDCTGPLG